jgi:predicted amidophosphoribosyltransferase
VLAVVFPSRCPACHDLLRHPSRGPLCEPCWDALPRHRRPLCPCGLPLALEGAGECGRCRRGLNPTAAGASLGPYEGSLRAVLHELKYRGRRRAARRLAEELLDSVAVRRLLTSDAVLVPVPLHPRRRRERGFNQSELLAAELARHTGLRAAPGALVRRRARVSGRPVVLVDDVLTTGATARGCARVLREAGASEVRVLTVARVW